MYDTRFSSAEMADYNRYFGDVYHDLPTLWR